MVVEYYPQNESSFLTLGGNHSAAKVVHISEVLSLKSQFGLLVCFSVVNLKLVMLGARCTQNDWPIRASLLILFRVSDIPVSKIKAIAGKVET